MADYINAEWREIDTRGQTYDIVIPPQKQIPLDESNPDPRIPCVLLVDTSGSMAGDRIAKVNRLIPEIQRALAADDQASMRVEIAVVSFSDSAEVVQDFALPDQMNVPTLGLGGGTAMGAAIMKGIDMLEVRKAKYKSERIEYYRPWLILLTDGGATDVQAMPAATARIQDYQRRKKVVFIPIGIGADEAMFSTLRQISDRGMPLDESRWGELVTYLVNNFKSVSRSRPSDAVKTENPSSFMKQSYLERLMNP